MWFSNPATHSRLPTPAQPTHLPPPVRDPSSSPLASLLVLTHPGGPEGVALPLPQEVTISEGLLGRSPLCQGYGDGSCLSVPPHIPG